jgi:hypothetical protein
MTVGRPRRELEPGFVASVLAAHAALGASALGVALLAGGAVAFFVALSAPQDLARAPAWLPAAAVALGGLALVTVSVAALRASRRAHRAELEFDGLVEEIRQEFDKVGAKHELLAEALSRAELRVARLQDAVRRQERERAPSVAVRVTEK